jgi:hypothetical protein
VPGQALRFDLTSVQAKFALVINGDRYLKPRLGAPTIHVLKVETADGRSYRIVADEFLRLQVFRRLGLQTVDARRAIIAGGLLLALIRYDRNRCREGRFRRVVQGFRRGPVAGGGCPRRHPARRLRKLAARQQRRALEELGGPL